MSLSLDLNKSASTLRLALDKAGVTAGIKAELIIDIDVSGSFEHEHEEGTTSKLIERLVPYGMVLDPDGQIDMFTFSNGEGNVHHVGTVTPQDAEGYITRNVVEKVPGWNGGTTYSYVLERNLEHFGWKPCDEKHATPGVGGFLSRFFGRKKEVQSQPHLHEKKRSIVLFVTDGENDPSDEVRTMRILGDSEQRGDQVYFLLIGACEHNDDNFRFLRTIADRFKNTGVVIITDLDSFVDLSDDEMNARLLGPELLAWLKS
ncbi:MAG: VWA domain-containing protein [Gemmatimonadota bacterium]|nr:VWA domain-containing protein [Gemmatimonadota bacterium]